MKVVATNSAADLAREHAMLDVQSALAELAANLLRVIRGAGKPYMLPRNAADFLKAVVAYNEITGPIPFEGRVLDALDIGYDLDARLEMSPDNQERTLAEEQIVQGALQIAASQILGQKTQERAGSSEMHAGIRDLEALRRRQRLAREAELQPKKPLRPRTTRKSTAAPLTQKE